MRFVFSSFLRSCARGRTSFRAHAGQRASTARLRARFALAASPALFVAACSASHAPDHCDETWRVDFDRRACADSVDQESDPADGTDGGSGPRRRDGSVRDARVDASFDPELDGDGPCKPGLARKCQCSSGAYSDQRCQPDRSWAACACDGPPPLVFGDAALPRDASRPTRTDASVRDAGPTDAAVEPDTSVQLGPQLTYVPAAPTVAVPDCRAPAPAARPARSVRWLAYRAESRTESTLQLVELGEAGPGLPIEAGPIDAMRPLGAWSSDGAQFAFTARADGSGAASVRLAGVASAGLPPTLVVAATSATFESWAPGLPRLAVRADTGNGLGLKVFDTTAPLRELAALPIDTGNLERTSWSPDGRYLGLSQTGAPGLSFWDLNAASAPPTMVDTSGRYLSWSPDGKRFVYLRSGASGELWAGGWNGTVVTKQLVSAHVSTPGARFIEPVWLGADRLFWREAGAELFVTDLRGETPVTTPLGLQPPYFSVSPGGVCIAYSGPCSASGAQGVCVRKLDPTGSPVPAHVSNLPWGGVVWSETGDQLALSSPAGTVVEALNLDAQPFAPQLLALGREGQFLRTTMAWAPGVPARWLAFHVPGERRAQQTLSLWSVVSKKAVLVELGDQSAQSFAWSPDGRDLMLQSYDPGGAAASPARLLLQRVSEGALGSQWIVVGPDLPQRDLTGDLFSFQP
ncbi:MAG: Eukaryotic translation initiation factor eIF2A [Pseudomonadota bacterium]|jgi:hypothetical protein